EPLRVQHHLEGHADVARDVLDRVPPGVARGDAVVCADEDLAEILDEAAGGAVAGAAEVLERTSRQVEGAWPRPLRGARFSRGLAFVDGEVDVPAHDALRSAASTDLCAGAAVLRAAVARELQVVEEAGLDRAAQAHTEIPRSVVARDATLAHQL